MLRKVFRTGNSVVISLPKDALQLLGVAEGEEVSIDLDKEKHQVIITPVEKPVSVAGIDEGFAQQINCIHRTISPSPRSPGSIVIYLTAEQILFIHARLVDETGGSHGVRDLGLLMSATCATAGDF